MNLIVLKILKKITTAGFSAVAITNLWKIQIVFKIFRQESVE